MKNKFLIKKNTLSICYIAETSGSIINGIHNSDNIHYKQGDWICQDPNNENDVWPISQSLHGNYEIVEKAKD